MRAHIRIATLVLLLTPAVVPGLTAATANAEVITVCWDGSEDYLTIQEGIDAASDGDEVVVCDGVYTGDGNKNLDFAGRAITVRSANGPENCIIDCGGHVGFYFYTGESETSVLDGFMITNGAGSAVYGAESSPTIANCLIVGNGGGITAWQSGSLITGCTISHNDGRGLDFEGASSSPTVTDCTIVGNSDHGVVTQGTLTMSNCTISGNRAEASSGGGVACRGSSSIRNCTITGNAADYRGGGVYCYGGSPTISNCTITGNTARSDGGGVHCNYSSPTIVNCTITGNTAWWGGGGIDCTSGDNPMITDCIIMGNTAEFGGGVYCEGSSPTISNCTIADNLAAWFGGGVSCDAGAAITNCVITGNTSGEGGGGVTCGRDTTISNCTIAGNTAQDGGGVFGWYGNLVMADCTITGNVAGEDGGGVNCYDHSSATITNCVLWDNAAARGPQIAVTDDAHTPSTATVSFSDVEGGEAAVYVEEDCELIWGVGNIDADPLFAHPDDWDYRLSAGSPCIDAGCNWGVPPDIADLDGDGDTSEITPLDLDSEGRFFDDPDTADTGCTCPPIVDMGAYEFGETGPQPCLGDLDCDRHVGPADLGVLLAAWETCTDGDLNCDGVTDQADLGILLAHWGEECP